MNEIEQKIIEKKAKDTMQSFLLLLRDSYTVKEAHSYNKNKE